MSSALTVRKEYQWKTKIRTAIINFLYIFSLQFKKLGREKKSHITFSFDVNLCDVKVTKQTEKITLEHKV